MLLLLQYIIIIVHYVISIVVNLLSGIIYKSNFIIQYVCTGKTIIYIQFGITLGFRHLLGVLETPMDERVVLYRNTIILKW